ncbi:hypothetical protein OG564_25060 [Streptomyces sp. NBC_01280]|uniref:hypothetical protein n=1 Tax=Streptomyces sp. NBC_01280 TaxID=2903810 RepID=UPI002E375B0A|nr:hypothetical protein [Streptomyces sp. NBC_01280]
MARNGGVGGRGVVAWLKDLARFESVAVRGMLLGIFVTGMVAEFVKPVGDALQGRTFVGGALLSLVGYVLYDAVKDLAASVERAPARSRVRSSDLPEYVREAFGARKVDICFLGYTGETLKEAVYERLNLLLDGNGQARDVSIRMLVPDFGRPMALPSRVGPGGEPVDDPGFRDRLADLCQEYDDQLQAKIEEFDQFGGVRVTCEYRLYHGVPRDKICIFNESLVLHGLYDVSVTMRWRGERYYDPKGFQTDLSVWSLREGTDGAEGVVMWTKHFNDLWALAAVPPWRRQGPPTR